MTTPRLLSNRYELGETLGYGGMSEVHRGRDVRLGRDVAVKVLRADLARDPQFQERFRREAQNAAALNHPAIVAVYDTGETQTADGPLPYIVMEYVDGRTLRDIVKSEGPLAGQRAMEIMADVCAALDFSHRHGIVHRDVKPANVMITRTGAVKVMDFGIARAVADGQMAVTQTAAVIGTAQYLSPEQARGEAVDARSDVYATGCVLFELLTGEPPFTGDSPVAVAYQHVREDPKPPSALNPRVSPQLDAIVLKAMAKGAPNRYQSAAEMRTDIVRVLSGQRPAAPMVMTDEDRTSIMAAGRYNDARPTGRHRPDALVDDYDDYDPYASEEADRRRRRRNILIGVGVAALIVAILVAFGFASGVFGSKTPTGTSTVSVADVRGTLEAEARRTLNGQGFTNIAVEQVACATTGSDPCSQDQVGKVFDENPAPGSQLQKSDRITLKVGSAAPKVTLPPLSGKTRDEATAALQAIGLQVNPDVGNQVVEDSNLIDKVVDTDPPAGQQVASGSTVKLIIGKGPDQVAVPDVTGQTFDKASDNLTRLGFKVVRGADQDSDQPAGTVIGQSPKSGKAKPGATITLTVSNGNQQNFSMPSLIDKTKDQATTTLKGLGWTGSFNVADDTGNKPQDCGTITDQQQNPGENVAKNATIGIQVVTAIRVGGQTVQCPSSGGGG